jgi:redox-sensitive bicupin YhaK (pirin superfamily)
VRAGEDATLLNSGQVGWLDRPQGEGVSRLHAAAGDEGARLVLYSGQPQGDNIVSRGPFIGDSQDDIRRLYAEYRAGRFQRMSELARAKRPA